VTRIICGVDVASKSLEARIGQQGAAGSFPNNPEGVATLAAFCHAHQVELVTMEATGGYEQQALTRVPCASSRKAWAGWRRPTPSTPA
jgi:transposase